jgi:hypothetical protein
MCTSRANDMIALIFRDKVAGHGPGGPPDLPQV